MWRREEGDEGREYQHQTILRAPGNAQEVVITEGVFRFKAPIQRFMADFGGPPIPTPGTLLIRNRIRPVGTDEWLSQSYEITIEKLQSQAEELPTADAVTQ